MYIFLQKALYCTLSGDFHTGEYDEQKTSFSVLRKMYIFLQKALNCTLSGETAYR